jgi:hypothetical protein
MDFSKHQSNLFVLFHFKDWTDKIAPYGALLESIGAVNHLPSYYRYLLLCKNMEFHPNHWFPASLRTSLTTSCGLTESSKPRKGASEDWVFSIDPSESRDLDDAFSFHWRDSVPGGREAVVKIYIADVVHWMDVLDKWDAMRIEKVGASTLYLPDQNHPLLPRWISDKGGSLLEGERRPVVALELLFRETREEKRGEKVKMEFGGMRFFRDWVTIEKNFRYDTHELEECGKYREFLDFTRGLVSFSNGSGIENSHDLVEYWMIEYNIRAGQVLADYGRGIFRKVHTLANKKEVPSSGGVATRQFLKHYKNTRGEYVFYHKEDSKTPISEYYHTTIREGTDQVFYAHASSPLRRIVDIYNQLGLVLSIQTDNTRQEGSQMRNAFRLHLEQSVKEINRQNRVARRIQNECEMLTVFFSYDSHELSASSYEGIVVDWEFSRSVALHGDDLDAPKRVVVGYWVFLEEWKRLVYVERQGLDWTSGFPSVINTEEEEKMEIGETGKYQIFLFEDEENTHRKIIIRKVSIDRSND